MVGARADPLGSRTPHFPDRNGIRRSPAQGTPPPGRDSDDPNERLRSHDRPENPEVIPGLTVFDDEQTNSEADAAVRIDDLGDDAVTVGSRLFVLVGDRAFMVNRETTDDGSSAEGAEVEALARAVVARQG